MGLPFIRYVSLLAVAWSSAASAQAERGSTPGERPEPAAIVGKVVEVADDNLSVRYMGAVIRFVITKETRLEPALHSVKDLRPGQEVRTTFIVKGTSNVAQRIELSGSGAAETQPNGGSPTQANLEEEGDKKIPVEPAPLRNPLLRIR